jgi:hypothetical protein
MIVRFTEAERYDISQDKGVTLFMGSTPKGTYHTEQHCENSKSLRETREKFKAKVFELMQSGTNPGKIAL